MTYSNDPRPNPYAHIPSPIPNIDFPVPYWINRLADLIIIGCLNPDLAYGALAVPAALKMMYDVESPSTKQIIQGATGRSWLCGTKQVMSNVKTGAQIATSDTGRFVYGLMAGLDTASYYAFMLSSGAAGVIDFATFAQKFQRVCTGNQSPFRGLTPIGGWPTTDPPQWNVGPSWDAIGGRPGPFLSIPTGHIGAMIAWCSFSSLFGTGGVITSMRIRDEDTNEIYDSDTVNNLFSVSNMAVVRYFTTGGRAPRDMNLALEVSFPAFVSTRIVPVSGGCFIRAWAPTASDAPPYWNVKDMIKSHAPG